MQIIEAKNYTFYYPGCDRPALDSLDFTVEQGSFLLVCGPSGCGKTTLLRQLKNEIAPEGMISGSLTFKGIPIETMERRVSAGSIGFVGQDPEAQIITDKVWHELAFGLESLGLKRDAITARVAEMANWFDIQRWFRRGTADLSGGEKQILSLASAMVMKPEVLVLDEPLAQLDPASQERFVTLLGKINSELGTTVIMAEHHTGRVLPMADRVMVMEHGRISEILPPEEVTQPGVMPSVLRIYRDVTGDAPPVTGESVGGGSLAPITVREGKLWLDKVIAGRKAVADAPESAAADGAGCREDAGTALMAKDLYYSYDKHGAQVLRGLSVKVPKASVFAIVGGNGSGKSTLLRVIAGLDKPLKGKVTAEGRRVMLPQDPKALFSEVTTADELLAGPFGTASTDEEKAAAAGEVMELFGLTELADIHPYDLSGGEMQMLALAKVMLTGADIMLLDEPTKGMDQGAKAVFGSQLGDLTAAGQTVVIVSHDIEFCAEYADICGMLFDGELISVSDAKSFFAGNSFYTTDASRMVREYFPEAVTAEQAARAIKGII